MAWVLRRLLVFAIGGRGDYRLRPIPVEDVAGLCADLGARTGPGNDGAAVVDAVGPQSLTFRQLVEEIRDAVGSHSVILPVPGALIPALAAVLNVALRDTLLTASEYTSMAAGPADSAAPATGHGRFTDWGHELGGQLARSYATTQVPRFRKS